MVHPSACLHGSANEESPGSLSPPELSVDSLLERKASSQTGALVRQGACKVNAALLAAALQRGRNLDFKEVNGPFFCLFKQNSLTAASSTMKPHFKNNQMLLGPPAARTTSVRVAAGCLSRLQPLVPTI